MLKHYIKIIRHVSNLLDYIVIFAFILLFLIGSYGILDMYSIYAVAQNKSSLKYKPEAGAVLVPEITDNIAWLTLDDSPIDYAIMQGDDNETYVNRDVYGDYSLSGSIFLDYRNRSDFSDDYNLVYGHHMEKEMMFGALDNWEDEEYFSSHRTGTLTTVDKIYELTVYAIIETKASEMVIFQPGAYDTDSIICYVQQKQINFDEFMQPEHLLALSTCKYPDTDDRTVLICEMTEVYRGETVLDQTEQETIKETQNQVGGKVFMNVKPIAPNPTWLDTLLKWFGWL